jgi:hypothetical protein
VNCPTSWGAIIIETVGVGAQRGTGLGARRVDDGPDELVTAARMSMLASRVGFMFKGRSSLIEIVPDRIFDLDPRAKPWFADGIKAAS